MSPIFQDPGSQLLLWEHVLKYVFKDVDPEMPSREMNTVVEFEESFWPQKKTLNCIVVSKSASILPAAKGTNRPLNSNWSFDLDVSSLYCIKHNNRSLILPK